ncbi:MAG: hypothetical protein K2X53_05990 [Alphaproteobacteria bacterium]|nr:hypothetical protein [Alphaproteobacteria bacterium]
MKKNLSRNNVAAFTFLSLLLCCTTLNQNALHACRTRPVIKQERENPFPKSLRSLPKSTKSKSAEDSGLDNEYSTSSKRVPSDSYISESTDSSLDEIFKDSENDFYAKRIPPLNDADSSDIRISHLINLSANLMARGEFDEARHTIEKFYDDYPNQNLYFLHLLCILEVYMENEALEKFIPPAYEVLKLMSPKTHPDAVSELLSHQNISTLEELIEDWIVIAPSPHDSVKLDWLQAMAGLTKKERTHLAQCSSRLSLHTFRCGHVAKHFRQIDPTNWERAVDVVSLLATDQNDMARAEYLVTLGSLEPDRWDPLVQSVSSISSFFKPATLPFITAEIAKLSKERQKLVVDTIKVIAQQSNTLPLLDVSFMASITVWNENLLSSLQRDLLTLEPGEANFASIMQSHIVHNIFTK